MGSEMCIRDRGDSDTATVTVSIEQVVVDPPAAVDDLISVAAGGASAIDVLANDTYSTDVIAIEVVTQPSIGSVSVNPETAGLTYSSGHMASVGTVTEFTYVIEDAAGQRSNPATVTLTLVPGMMVHTHHEMIPNPVYGTNVRVAEACKGVAQGCDWSSASTWVTGAVPDGDSRVIVDGHVRIQDLNALARSIGIYPEGKLAFAANDLSLIHI